MNIWNEITFWGLSDNQPAAIKHNFIIVTKKKKEDSLPTHSVSVFLKLLVATGMTIKTVATLQEYSHYFLPGWQ